MCLLIGTVCVKVSYIPTIILMLEYFIDVAVQRKNL